MALLVGQSDFFLTKESFTNINEMALSNRDTL